MRFSHTFTLELDIKQFYNEFELRVSKNYLRDCIRQEMFHICHGIVDGEWGGSALNWKIVLYKQLIRQGLIKQTELSLQIYGDLTN